VKPKWAAAFDMDGVIVDNREFHFRAWLAFTEKHGLEFEEERFKNNLFGRTNREILEGLFGRRLSETAVRVMADEKEALYRRLYESHVRPTAGLEGLLREMAAGGVPAAVCTAAPRVNLDFVLDRSGLRPYFSVLVDESLVARGKPAPDLYLKAAELLGLPASRCVAFEDSLPGVASARAAGMKVVALTTTHAPDELAGADLVVPDFTGLTLRRLEALLGVED
jgi:HAD superfamily hydrolase (TIGR01509 family)